MGLSDETKKKLSEALKGRVFSEEHKAKIGAAHKGLRRSEEARKNMSEAAKRRPKRELPEGMQRKTLIVLVDGIESKSCSECKEMKPLTEYNKDRRAKNGTGIMYRCRDCARAYSRAYYSKNDRLKNQKRVSSQKSYASVKVEAIEYLGGACVRCRVAHVPNENTVMFQFHHRNPAEKDFAITEVRARVFDTIKEELDKCDLLCANCHFMTHAEISKRGYEAAAKEMKKEEGVT